MTTVDFYDYFYVDLKFIDIYLVLKAFLKWKVSQEIPKFLLGLEQKDRTVGIVR